MYLAMLAVAVLMAACGGGGDQASQDIARQGAGAGKAEVASGAATSSSATAAGSATGTFSGDVAETMDAGGYTYVLLDTGTERLWIAGPQTEVTVGTQVSVSGGMLMQEFTSSKLERTFENIWFVPAIVSGDAATAATGASTGPPAGHPELPADSAHDFEVSAGIGSDHTKVAQAELVELARVSGGQTIAQIHSEKDVLSGNEVLVRGKVVKFTPEVMDRNWLHIQDGTGEGESSDLTVTTSARVKVGDIVLVRGRLVTDKDFGYGYHYAVLVEDAEVTVE